MSFDFQVRRMLPTRHAVWVFLVTIGLSSGWLVAPEAFAQARSAPKGKENPELKPRVVTLKTRDGLKLRAGYFPSDKGKEAIPVLLVHEWTGQGSPYTKLAMALRDAGCAVLIPDYRGHGGSRSQIGPRGNEIELNPATMRTTDVNAILNADLEAAKGFLKEENNKGLLNLNALAVIGIREGGILAAHWTVKDWRFPSIGSKKQGQDVKALVLISPEKVLKGLGIEAPIKDPTLLQLPIMIVAGQESSEASEATRIGRQIESMKKRVSRGDAQGFALLMPPTNFSGYRLIDGSRELTSSIVSFITGEIMISDESNAWIERD